MEVIEARFLAYEKLSQEWAEAQAAFDQLEDFKKVKRAVLMKKYEGLGAKSAAIQERDAYADPEYGQLLKGVQSAQERSLAMKQQLKAMELRFEYWRTTQATKRAEMNLR
jgi:hypothetical protein